MRSLLAAMITRDAFGGFVETIETVREKVDRARYVRDITRDAKTVFNIANLVRRNVKIGGK